MYNNPARIATWECARLWPDKAQMYEPHTCRIDYLISLGTGTSPSDRYTVGPHSPKTDRFLPRLASWASGSLDSEVIWKSFLSCIPESYRSRCLRLNLHFPGTEPALNDVNAIGKLKEQTKDSIRMNLEVAQARDYMIASVFYFELDTFTRAEGGAYECSGNILCRLPLNVESRKSFFASLKDNSTSFHSQDRRLASIKDVPQECPPFRLSVGFVLQSRQEKLDILVKGITSRAMSISGMPASLQALIEAENLDAPFGCIDSRVERPLPTIPLKRKLDEI